MEYCGNALRKAKLEHLDRLYRGADEWNRWKAYSRNVHVDLNGVTLSQEKFVGVDLSEVFLLGADLSGTDFSRASLHRSLVRSAVFSHAILVETDLSGADLFGADFSCAVLRLADFTDAFLKNTKFLGTNLSEVRGLTQAQINLSEGDGKTELPAGLRRPDAWIINDSRKEPMPGFNESERQIRIPNP